MMFKGVIMKEVDSFLARNGEEIIIRPAEPADSDQLADALRSSSSERSYVLMEQYGKDSDAAEKYISEIDRQKNMLFVATAAGKVVGGLAALQADGGKRPHSAHILNVGLHLIENYRGLGIGTRMLEHIIEWARDHGYRKLSANIFTTNKRSLHLFAKAGFSEECIRKKQIRIGREFIDEICMVKFLE
jgi:L-amino acid N-acyltransferase YncA